MDKTNNFDYMDFGTWDRNMRKDATDAALAFVAGVSALAVGVMALAWTMG